MKKLSLLIIISTLIAFSSDAQISFDKTYGSIAREEARSVLQTIDGGYIIGGTNLIKIDSLGNEEWSKPFASTNMNLTKDSSYILVNNIGKTILFSKVSSNGDSLWQTSYKEGIWANEGNYIEQTFDGGYIVAGRFQSVTGSGLLLLKLDASGNKVWRRAFTQSTSAGFNYAYSAQQTKDSGYIVSGYTYWDYYDSTRHEEVILIKTDSLGQEKWRKYFGGSSDDAVYAMQIDSEGSFILAGKTKSNTSGESSDMYLIKVDSLADSVWVKTYGGAQDESASGLWVTQDGGYILAGQSNTFTNGDYDAYVLKVDKNGDTLWTKNYGGIGVEKFYSIQQTSDNGYIMAGSTDSKGAGDSDMWIIKTDSVGHVEQVAKIKDTSTENLKCTIYPNPSNGIFSIKSGASISAIRIMNLLGEIVYSKSIHLKEPFIDVSNLFQGAFIYHLDLENNQSQNGILIIE